MRGFRYLAAVTVIAGLMAGSAATAAKALNTALGTTLFSAGLNLGTAATLLRF